MKNSLFYKLIIFIFIFFLIFQKNGFATEEISIDAEIVDIQEKGNLIIATGSVTMNDGSDIKITGDKANYNRSSQIIEINGNVILIDKNKNYEAKSDKLIFNRNNQTLEIFNNIKLKDFYNNYEINSQKIIYKTTIGEITSIGETQIYYNNKFTILTRDVFFNKNSRVFFTENKTKIKDDLENEFSLSSLEFDINKKIFKSKNLEMTDKEENILKFKNGIVNFDLNEIVGSDFIFTFNKNSFGNYENDPRLIGRYLISNKSKTTMKKSIFTTCKKINGKCPAWSISADEIVHKNEKKRIEYKNAWLKIYDTPVAYFPYFFHPDPTVKRQSGFLFPQFNNNNNLGFSTQIPYYKVIDNNKDLTISPRVFTNNNLFAQTEYRQAFKNSNLITDFSYNKKDNSNSHFFSTLTGDFEDSFYEMKIETVSNDNYLKKYQVKSPIIDSYSSLNSLISYEKYTDEYKFSSSINIFEDLTKIDSDRYEYLLPSYDFMKEKSFEGSTFNNISLKSSGNYRKFNTNVDEADIVNDLVLSSDNYGQFNNLENEVNILLRNVNTYGDYSSIYKEDTDHKLIGSFLVNLKYPLIKENSNGKKFLTPIASLRYSPNKGVNLKNENTLVTFEDLLRIDRVKSNTIETGASATLGFEHKHQTVSNIDKLKFGAAINIRNKIDEDLPQSSSLGEKTSDIIGYSGINITENIAINYNFSLEQNLSGSNYSLLSANYDGEKLQTTFEYMEKSNFIGDESYLTSFTKLNIDKKNSLGFEANKNLDKDLTNYYNLIYSYQNDCLEASLVYNKQFYSDQDVNSGKNIFFKISFKPFGSINSPNLND